MLLEQCRLKRKLDRETGKEKDKSKREVVVNKKMRKKTDIIEKHKIRHNCEGH
jgi:hypothetical protein